MVLFLFDRQFSLMWSNPLNSSTCHKGSCLWVTRARVWVLKNENLSTLLLLLIRDLRSFEIQFESAVPIRFKSHGQIRKFLNRSCLPIARRSQAINGT